MSKTEALTPEERKWLNRVQRAIDACPSDDIGFYSIGDPNLTVYRKPDGDFSELTSDFCTSVDDAGAYLGRLTFPSCVHSTAG